LGVQSGCAAGCGCRENKGSEIAHGFRIVVDDDSLRRGRKPPDPTVESSAAASAGIAQAGATDPVRTGACCAARSYPGCMAKDKQKRGTALAVNVPLEMAQAVFQLVRSGAYASAGAVVRAALTQFLQSPAEPSGPPASDDDM
jgi:hypothetical protein